MKKSEKHGWSNDKIIDAIVIFLTVMLVEEGYGRKGISRIWGEICKLCEMVEGGYISTKELASKLYLDAGIILGDWDIE